MRRKSACKSQLSGVVWFKSCRCRASRRRWCPPTRPAAHRPAKWPPAGGLLSCLRAGHADHRHGAGRFAPRGQPAMARRGRPPAARHTRQAGRAHHGCRAPPRPGSNGLRRKVVAVGVPPGQADKQRPGPAQRESQQTDVISVRASPRRRRQPVFWISRRRSIWHHAPKNVRTKSKLYTHQICRQQSPPCRWWFNIVCSARGSKNSALPGG